MKAVLSIAGSDSSGGAGIQADLKTITAHHLFGMTAITALTAQNTTGVFGTEEVNPAFVEQQIDVVFDDIRPAAVKIGMVPSPEIAYAIACSLKRNEANHVVVDPVMVATSGSALVTDESIEAIVNWLFPLAEVITPNLFEAQILSGVQIDSSSDMEYAAEKIVQRIEAYRSNDVAVLVKGGHVQDSSESVDDLLYASDSTTNWISGKRIATENTHGTGCTLSSAIACGLACGLSVQEAVREAKDYVSGALSAGLNLGRGSGPLDHMWQYR